MGKIMKVPYEKRGFSVKNMPEGVEFKKPSGYGLKQIKKIMNARDEIKFVIDASDASTTAPTHLQSLTYPEPEGDLLSSTVSAIVGKVVSFPSLDSPFDEETVEVENLLLTQEQRCSLYAHECRQHFTDDAWVAIGANMICEEPKVPGVILALYTTAKKENFWLFYTEEKLKKIQKLTPNATINGYWLQLEKGSDHEKYHVLKDESNVFGKNLIKSEHGPIYYFYSIDAVGQMDHTFNMPKLFYHAICNILTSSGFMEK